MSDTHTLAKFLHPPLKPRKPTAGIRATVRVDSSIFCEIQLLIPRLYLPARFFFIVAPINAIILYYGMREYNLVV